jgi:hypothetical protein
MTKDEIVEVLVNGGVSTHSAKDCVFLLRAANVLYVKDD